MKIRFFGLMLAMLIGVCQFIIADEAFRNHRYDSWKVLGLPEGAIVFVGNSITDMPLWAEAFGNDPRVVNRGNAGGYSFEVLANVESWVRFKPAKVFIKIGTNDLGTNYDEYSIADNIRKTVDVIRRESPQTEIYLQSIIPAKNQNYKTPTTIKAANVLIKKIADETENTTYVNLYSKLGGVRDGVPYSLDNLHLEAYGYKIWTEAIKSYVGIESSYPSNTESIQNTADLGGAHGMRATYFSTLPTKSSDILFFGDEMVKNGEWNELLHNQNVKNRGTGWGYGGSIAVTSKLVDAAFANGSNGVTRETPAKILIYTGTEDINGSTDLASVEESYSSLIDKVKGLAAGTPIGVVSMMPTSSANSRITDFNTWLKATAEADDDITYIDIYTPLATSDGATNTAYFTGNYLYGMGYLQVARKLADFVGNCSVITDEEAQQMKDEFASRTSLNTAIITAEEVSVGDELGQYSETSIAPLLAKAESAKEILADNAATSSQIETAASEIETAMTELKQNINLLTEENTNDKQFELSTPYRSGLIAYSTGAAMASTTTSPGYATYRWTFEKREDGSFNIKNAGKQTYLDPSAAHNSQIMMMTEEPSAGWVLDYSDKMGLYIVRSGSTCELNATSFNGNPIYNWYGSGNEARNRTDAGCMWQIKDVTDVPVEDELEPPVIDEWTAGMDWYTMQIGQSGYYLSNNGSATYIALDNNQTEFAEADLWCRSGNDTDGYIIYNKEAGPDMVLGAPTTMTGTNGGTSYPIMVDKNNVPEGYTTVWQFAASSNLGSDVEAYYMYEKGYESNKVNNRDGKLAFWSAGADAGSSIQWTWAERTVAVNMSTGTFTSKNSNGTWAKTWTSTATEPQLTLDAGYNNMSVANSNDTLIQAFRGSYEPQSYTLGAGNNYMIAGYSFDFVMSGSTAITLTDALSNTYTSSAIKQTVECIGLTEPSATFVLSGSNNGINITNMLVTIRKAIEEPEPQFEVFPTKTTAAIPYRIPGIATAYDGTVVAVADYRYSRVDIGSGRIDLHIRRSHDNGETWDDIMTPDVMTGDGNTTEGHQEAGFGDPCIVGDIESPRMLLTSCSGTPGFFGGTRTHHQGWARWYSEDNGATWSKPEYIDEQFIYSKFDTSVYGPIRGWFVGSGKICQSRTTKVDKYYRLYLVGSSCRQGSNETANWALYSDDFGETWEFLGGCDYSPIPGGDEPKAEELPDGSILISSRCSGGRNYNIYTFTDTKTAAGSWGTVAFSGSSNNGVTALSNACNGEVMMVPVTRKADNKDMFLLLQSVPFGSGRSNVGIYYKELESLSDYSSPSAVAQEWTGRHRSSRMSSAYSTMTLQKNNTIGFVYEEDTYGTSGGGYTIIYKNYSIEQITDSAYSYKAGVDGDSLTALGMADYIKTVTGPEYVGTKVGQYSEDAAELINSAYEPYASNPTRSGYEKVNAAMATAPHIGIDQGVYYTFRNYGRGTQNYLLNASNMATMNATTETTSTNSRWRFVPTVEDPDVYYLVNEKFEASMFGPTLAVETRTVLTTNIEEAGKYRIISDAQGLSKLQCVNPTNASYCNIHLAGDCTRLVPWLANSPSANNASFWYIEPTEDIYTDVESIQADLDAIAPAADVYYDLQGRRVVNPQKGVMYIRRGRVVIKE